MIINKSGTAIRLRLKDIRVQGRATQGVRLINLEKRGDTISSVCQVPTEEEAETEEVTALPEDAEANEVQTENSTPTE